MIEVTPKLPSISHPPLEQIAWTLEGAFSYCRDLAEGHYENFPVGSRFIPRRLRPFVHSIYAFARVADDFADEPEYPDNLRLAFLENWEAQLLQSIWRKPQHPIFIALKETIKSFDLPVDLFQDLLMAFKMDVAASRHERFDDLLEYCRFSANPVGRLILLLFGYREPELHRLSDRICTALQLTNFWQDIALDLKKDRIYLPREDMIAFGVREVDLKAHRVSAAFRSLLSFELDRTRTMFREGFPLCEALGRDLQFEIRLIWNGGMRILDRIELVDYDVFQRRPKLTLGDKLRALALAAVKSGPRGDITQEPPGK